MKTFDELCKQNQIKRKKAGMSYDNWRAWMMLKTKMTVILMWLGVVTLVYFTGGNLMISIIIILTGLAFLWWIEIVIFDRINHKLTKSIMYGKALTSIMNKVKNEHKRKS